MSLDEVAKIPPISEEDLLNIHAGAGTLQVLARANIWREFDCCHVGPKILKMSQKDYDELKDSGKLISAYIVGYANERESGRSSHASGLKEPVGGVFYLPEGSEHHMTGDGRIYAAWIYFLKEDRIKKYESKIIS